MGSDGSKGRRKAAARAVDLVKTYGQADTQVVALDGVSIEFDAQEFTAIMGPSGGLNPGKWTRSFNQMRF